MPAFISARLFAARAGAMAMALPILLAGPTPSTAAILSHAMSPAADSTSSYEAVDWLSPDASPNARVFYTPHQIATAYDFQSLFAAGLNGAGRTIVIVGAYQNPFIVRDLNLFDHAFGLTGPPAFRTFTPDGLTAFDYSSAIQRGWSGEIAVDVQWAHAMAPGAAIDLVLAKSQEDADLNTALAYAVDHNLGDVISMSFGEGEACMDPAVRARMHHIFAAALRKGMTLVAAAGDTGAGQPDCSGAHRLFLSASIPASDPLVTAVGGTSLRADTAGAYIGESAWKGSGGGFSTEFKRPSYQKKKDGIGRMRGVPDVAYDAALDGGFPIVWSSSGFLGTTFGVPVGVIASGTSSGTPQWAALIAIADQARGERLGGLNGTIYALGRARSAAFHDITVGDNIVPVGAGHAPAGYSAAPGWDPVTGGGTPDAGKLVALLAATGRDGEQQRDSETQSQGDSGQGNQQDN